MDEFYISFHTKPRIGCTFTCDCGRDIKIDAVDDASKSIVCSHIDYDGFVLY